MRTSIDSVLTLALVLFGLLAPRVHADVQTSKLVLDVNDESSIRAAASILAQTVRNLYNGNEPGNSIGKWPYPPYYWWESGGAWGSLMHYWASTNDTTYNDLIMQALTSQVGPNNDFVIQQEAFDEGNDDQAFWVFVALSAAEYNFPEPPSPLPSWSTIAENAFNDYVYRWNTSMCNGGLKWQFHPENAGFYYKQSISNGAFFQISARLARYTGNSTYLDWANKVWDWTVGIGLISSTYDVYDGADDRINCTQLDHDQWTYNAGVFLYGAATLSNYTNQSQIWVDRTNGLLAATSVFFSPYQNATNVMFEAACETVETCNTDQYSMKAYLSRWMAATSVMAPYTAGQIGTYLRASAIGASNACTGGAYGNTCGVRWYTGHYEGDGQYGLGQQMSALEVVVGLLANNSVPPRTMPAQTPPSVNVPGDSSATSKPSSSAIVPMTTTPGTTIASTIGPMTSSVSMTVSAENTSSQAPPPVSKTISTSSTTVSSSTNSSVISTTSATAEMATTTSKAPVAVQTPNGANNKRYTNFLALLPAIAYLQI